jgi:hypothetical protein
MRLVSLASLVSATAAMDCIIVGGGNGLCRSCPAMGCEIIAQIPDGKMSDFTCIWQLGENVLGNKLVVYLFRTARSSILTGG